MKRGIVMEVKGKKAVILSENGQFETIRLPKGIVPNIGDSVSFAGQTMPGKLRKMHWLPAISTVAVIFIFVVLLGGFCPSHPDDTIAAYVSYDLNPSFTAGVNKKMQVVSVKPWNQDAQQLFANWDSYQFMKLQDFSHHVVELLASQGYLKDGSSNVLLASTVVLQDQKKRAKVFSALNRTINVISHDTALGSYHVKVAVRTADPKTKQEANANGLSLGKYLLYLDAKNNGKHLSIHTIQQMSVSDIEKAINGDALPVSSVSKKQQQKKSSSSIKKDEGKDAHDNSESSKTTLTKTTGSATHSTNELHAAHASSISQPAEIKQNPPVRKAVSDDDQGNLHAKHAKVHPHQWRKEHRDHENKVGKPKHQREAHPRKDHEQSDKHSAISKFVHDRMVTPHLVWSPAWHSFDKKTETQR